MTRLSLAHVLSDFDAPVRSEPRPELHVVVNEPTPEPAAPEPPPPAAPAIDVEEIWRTGFEAGQAALRAEADTILEEHERAFQARLDEALAEARESWALAEAAQIGVQVEQALRAIEGEMSEALARVLQPVLDHVLRNAAVRQFCELTSNMIRSGEAGRITVQAPASLAASLESRFAALDCVEVVAGDPVEVSLRSERTRVETRLSAITSLLGTAHGA